MTKTEKIAVLDKVMTTGKRDNGEVFYHFTDTAPRELKDLYLEHYEVRDIDYETFGQAIDLVRTIYEDKPEAIDDEATEEIYERASDSAGVYNDERLGYLNIWNQDDIAEIVRDMGVDIATACAVWYDRQVEQSAIIIKDWINA